MLLPAARCLLAPTDRRFRRALHDAGSRQRRVLAHAWAELRRTEFGSRFHTFEDVPIHRWADLAPWFDRERHHGPGIILSERPLFYEPTSGTHGAVKRIPYTRPMRRLFTHMFAIWAADLLQHGPRFRTGKCYFSVSPRLRKPETADDGRPIGSRDDRDYLAGWVGAVARPYFLSPKGIADVYDADAFRARLAEFLLLQPALEVISVWSPTFLTVLLDWMIEHRSQLPRSADIGRWTRIWPELKLISCWDSGSAAGPASRVRRAFPEVLVQGKGLLATESPMTVPLVDVGPVPLVDDVYIELLDGGDLRPLTAATVGATYEVVVTHAAGFARYRLGDVVEVTGHVGTTPILRFVGRAEGVDLTGEKLTEETVVEALRVAGLHEEFACLVAAEDRYVLVTTRREGVESLAQTLDLALQRHHHYRLSRELGQLRAIEGRSLPDAERRAMEAGRQWGGTKPPVLRASAPEFEFAQPPR